MKKICLDLQMDILEEKICGAVLVEDNRNTEIYRQLLLKDEETSKNTVFHLIKACHLPFTDEDCTYGVTMGPDYEAVALIVNGKYEMNIFENYLIALAGAVCIIAKSQDIPPIADDTCDPNESYDDMPQIDLLNEESTDELPVIDLLNPSQY